MIYCLLSTPSTAMSNESNLKKVQTYFEEALTLPEAKRADYVAKLCSREPELGLEVKALLENITQSKPRESTGFTNIPSIMPQSYQVGDDIGPYHIVEQIGVGGMGIIYKALDNRLRRYVALKFLPAHLNADDQIRQRFLAEARAASRLDHPNICVIYDVGETPQGLRYITMPYYEGETLDKRISRGALPLRDAVDIAIQIAEGLSSAHQHHIVHRDIKPSNIMLTRDGGVKVLDFGVAKIANADITGTGVSIGTLSYMSPEQLRGEPVDARTDVWALGLVLYECLCGKKAFPGKALPEILHSVLIKDQNPLDTLADQLPEPLLMALRQALARDPQQRFADMTTLLASLSQARTAMENTNAMDGDKTMLNKMGYGIGNIKPRSYHWDEKVLQKMVNILLPLLGPIAPVVVQRKAKVASDINELRLLLAESLPDQSSRDLFNKQVEIQVGALTSPPAPRALKTDGTMVGIELSPAQMANIEAYLIPYLGPIALTMIKRHAMNVTSTQELCDVLSQLLTDADEKQRFIQKMHTLFTKEND
jgi:serine/threonine protein kinase